MTYEEVEGVAISMSSAPAINCNTARQWRAVAASVKALLFNIVLYRGGFPEEMLISRTVLVLKKPGAQMPGDFRPISIALVVVRHLHKILAQRLRVSGLVDEGQMMVARRISPRWLLCWMIRGVAYGSLI